MARTPRRRAGAGLFHLLDMGSTKYGDCILAEFDARRILIDGGHLGDWKDRGRTKGLPSQLAELMPGPPFAVDLLVVTHCHGDHIGCLPRLVQDGTITAKWALVADENLGFGREQGGGFDALDQADALRRALVVAAMEEDHSDLPDAALEDFLSDAAKLEPGYGAMLETLQAAGTRVLRWGRATEAQIRELVDDFSDVGLAILGPTLDHLVLCAEQIQNTARDAVDALEAAERRDAAQTPAELYRTIMKAPREADPLDLYGAGSAKNCQSIVLAFGPQGARTLLAADMQFWEPQVDGLAEPMGRLIEEVANYGPYAFVKLTHHTSYNGMDQELLRRLGSPKLLAHSGGWNDPKHPDADSLRMLEGLDGDVVFARTDRNGLITIDPAKQGEDAVTISRGRLDDFSPNLGADDASLATAPVTERETSAAGSTSPDQIELVFVKLPLRNMRVSLGGFEVVISDAPSGLSAEPPRGDRSGGGRRKGSAVAGGARPALASGRDLSQLLFVTDPKALAKNIGSSEAAAAIAMIKAAGASIVEADGASAAVETLRRIEARPPLGVVLLGGYDVLPSQRVDVVDDALRGLIAASKIRSEPDQFVVWSDDFYVDPGREGMPDFPVTRIPDARKASVVFNALTAAASPGAGRFGIRNVARPFADSVFRGIAGSGAMLRSEPSAPSSLTPAHFAPDRHYYMLHGDHADGSRFWGERGGPFEALATTNIPDRFTGVVLTGACWGALTVYERASRTTGHVSPKAPERSIAVSYLNAGAQAFIGCTGAHYSPGPRGGSVGGPMHEAFWMELASGKAPARALFDAKIKYLGDMPHGLTEPLDIAIERKIYKQFTCLGLGW